MDPFSDTETPTWKKVLKYVAIGAAGLLALLVLFAIWVAIQFAGSGLGFSSGGSSLSVSPSGPAVGRAVPGTSMEESAYDSVSSDSISMPVPPPTPGPDYVAGLEDYEVTDYRVTARTEQFDEACRVLTELKADDTIDFRSLSESLNRCGARFFVDREDEERVRMQLSGIDSAVVTRTTDSVTRRRSELKNQTQILEEQLASVERTLLEAERQYDEIAELARQSSDASALTQAISNKLNMTNTLNARRIQLTERIRQLRQQSADLEERIGKAAFSVTINRSYPIDPDGDSRRWEEAWEFLKEQYTSVLIGFTAYLGVFLLRALQFAFYGLILIVLARLLWKFIRYVWRY